MSISVDVYKYDFNKLLDEIVINCNIQDRVMLGRILEAFGERIGDIYILVNNEHYEDDNSFYACSSFISKYFNVPGDCDPFGSFCALREEVNCNQSCYAVAQKLGVKLQEY